VLDAPNDEAGDRRVRGKVAELCKQVPGGK
jgi:hypothetical protein